MYRIGVALVAVFGALGVSSLMLSLQGIVGLWEFALVFLAIAVVGFSLIRPALSRKP
jgi:hypothetical protein